MTLMLLPLNGFESESCDESVRDGSDENGRVNDEVGEIANFRIVNSEISQDDENRKNDSANDRRYRIDAN